MATHTLIPLDNLLGAGFVGILASAVVFGITCLQIYLYYTEHATRDSGKFKAFMGLLFVADGLHLAFLAAAYYHYTVTSYGMYLALARPHWTLLSSIFPGVIVSYSVQICYAGRVYLLSKRSRWIAALIVALGFIKFVLGIMYAAVGIIKKVPFIDARTLEVYSVGGLSADIACDAVITGAMIVLLNRKRTAYDRTNRIIATLKTYVLQSCFLTTACAVTSLILWITLPHTLAYSPFYFLLIRLYLCSFLSILNTRNHLRSTMDAQDAVAFSNLDASTSGSPVTKASDFVLSANGGSTTRGVLPAAHSYHTEGKQPVSAFDGHTDP